MRIELQRFTAKHCTTGPLRALLWRRMGITRDAAGLAEAADRVDRWSRYIRRFLATPD